ncbi:peptidoglycan-binding domain-containing protein [Streptomyces sp. NRRL S-350]|uniref:peptidoglycan-binding domain-containing protein n=1 Tax=Streptomyces sp. NRRL S-350 TaxID=1463902 RepID=UPI00131D95E1|nr:peptidoglycan-binding domain-containing protein [Streptomyces sp. NRRL S-350]
MRTGATAARMAASAVLALSVVVGLGGTAQASTTAPYLRTGSSGQPVKCLQAFLNLAGLGHRIAVDGDFGPDTEGLVEDFQRADGLPVDGIVGPRTGTALWNYYNTYVYPRVMDYCYDYLPTQS